MRGLGRWGVIAAMSVAMFAGTAAAQVKRVAVVETELDAQSGAAKSVNKAEVRQITAVLRKEAVKRLPQGPGKYEIMTSETVMAQGSAKLEECADENCVITLGSMIGADYIVRGTISKVGTKLTTSVDIFETENGNLVASSDLVRAGNIEELLDKTAAACAEMYKTFDGVISGARKTTGQQTPTPQPQQAYQPPPQQTYQLSAPAQTYQQPVYTPPPPLPPPPTASQRSGVDGSGMLTDGRDGKRYKTVVIGGKRWMAENLNYQTSSGSWCYDNNSSNCGKYGRLYDWKTAKTVCPAGFHLPSRQEWDDLVSAAGGKSAAGKKLKARSGWSRDGNGTDDYGFSALPGGNRNPDGAFNYVGKYGGWWTASEYSGDNAYTRGMNYGSDYVGEGYNDKSIGFSVRCRQDVRQ